ncbi:zinc-dependent alcohol dehydrogenase [Hansschlegelia zhihuaiae]|uniref:Zinc-binding alcohol dehydrogenase n=1 Tax=Hansschlegelia zhihuaiae TaxID=405005 RepID=A0A4Q0MHD9_9HYPH|nr:zinc-binding alcohol dehydrogenase [Hansschlegelia zhihuaiae]RXF72844.1 zinc-binding alcohol dehydrogenase [Hansschlegelia zhihuaiae]
MQASDNGGEAGEARSLWYLGDGRVELRAASGGDGEACVRSICSGVSRGTERLVLEGRVPESEWRRMRAPRQEGEFPGPVKYGYAAVGVVEEGPRELVGRRVFCLNPHEEAFRAPASALHPLPEGLPSRRATLAANMETALNALWDSGAGACDRIVVVGGGVVGLLVASLAARLPGAEVVVVDVEPGRRSVAERLGAGFASPGDAPRDADVVLHASASAAGLATALSCAGEEASVVEMSWHGSDDVAVPLGRAFHARRLKLISSQVGQVAPSRRPRWSSRRRLAAALELLAAEPRLDDLIDVEIPFEDASRDLPPRLAAGAPGLGIVLSYTSMREV